MTLPKSSLERQYHQGFWTPEKSPSKICGVITQTGVVGVSPAVAVRDGADFTAAYVGVGIYSITTTETHFSQMLSALATVEVAANNVDLYAQIASVVCGPGAATVVEIRTKTGAVSTEVPQDDDVHFELNLLSIGQDVA